MDPIGSILGHSSATRTSPAVLRESPHGTAMPLDQGGTLSRMHRTATTLRAKLSEYIPAKMSIRPAWDFYSPESLIVWRCVVRSPDSGTRHNVARSGYNHRDGVPQKDTIWIVLSVRRLVARSAARVCPASSYLRAGHQEFRIESAQRSCVITLV